MKKLLPVLFVLATFTAPAQAQPAATPTPATKTPFYKKLNLTVSAGACVPLRDYSKKTFNTPNTAADTANITGFASTGFNINIGLSYKLSKKIGFMLQVGQSVNSFNNEAYAVALNTSSSKLPASTSQNIKSGRHYIGQYFIGPCLSLPLEDNVSFEAHILFGAVTGVYPTIIQSQTDPQYKINTTTQYNNGTGFGYNVGIGLKCMFTKQIGIQLTASYVGSNMAYRGYYYNYSYTPTNPAYASLNISHSTYNNMYMAIGMLNLTTGFSFSF